MNDWVMWGGFFAINALAFHTMGYARGHRNGKKRGMEDAALAECERGGTSLEDFKSELDIGGTVTGRFDRRRVIGVFRDPTFPHGDIEDKPVPDDSVEGANSGRPVQLLASEKVLKGLHRFETERTGRIADRTDAFDEAKKGGSPKDPRVRN